MSQKMKKDRTKKNDKREVREKNRKTIEGAHALLKNQGCILCGKKSDAMGTFIPEDQEAVQAPKGKARACFYPICQKCASKPENKPKIEDILMQQYWSSFN